MADPTFRVVVTLDGVDVTSELGEWSTDAGRSNPLERIGLATASITLPWSFRAGESCAPARRSSVRATDSTQPTRRRK